MSVTEAIKEKVTAVAQTAKIADLQRDTIVQSAQTTGLTTDHGVKVPDHDNWCVFLSMPWWGWY